MKRLAADDPVRVVRTLFREIYDQAIDQIFHQGIGRVGVRQGVQVIGGFELQHGGGSSGFSPGIKKPARGWFMKGDWGFSKR